MRRVLGLGDLLLIAAAAMGPAFSLATSFGPMVEAGGSGSGVALLFVVAIMACVALAYRRLGARYPNAGSTYTWVRVAFGPVAGAYAAWILIVANIFAMVATAVPAGMYTLALVAPGVEPSPLAAALIGTLWVFGSGVLLWRGLRPTSRVANALAIAELLVLAAAAAFAFGHAPVAHAVRFEPLPGAGALIGAMAIGIWMLDGWEVSASTAEESRDARHAPGAGGLAGLLLTAAILWICTTAFLRVGTAAGFGVHEGDAMAYVGEALGGPVWRLAITATVLLSLAASLQTTLVYLTRSFFAMGRDAVLPPALGALDARDQPTRAIVLITGMSMACTLGSGLSASIRDAFDFILSGTAVFLGVLFLLSAAAAVRIFGRERGAPIDGVFLPGIATVALAGILVVAALRSDHATQWFLAILTALGIPFALWRGRSGVTGV